jgi:hypothetical protein
MSTKRYLPSDVSSDIHQIIAKAIFLRLVGGGPLILPRAEMDRAAEAEFEYDIFEDGSILFRPAQDA